jgi:hypothetical protein
MDLYAIFFESKGNYLMHGCYVTTAEYAEKSCNLLNLNLNSNLNSKGECKFIFSKVNGREYDMLKRYVCLFARIEGNKLTVQSLSFDQLSSLAVQEFNTIFDKKVNFEQFSHQVEFSKTEKNWSYQGSYLIGDNATLYDHQQSYGLLSWMTNDNDLQRLFK